MTALPRLATALGLLLAASAAFAHETAVAGGGAGMLLLLGAAAMMLGLRPRSGAQTRSSRRFREDA